MPLIGIFAGQAWVLDSRLEWDLLHSANQDGRNQGNAGGQVGPEGPHEPKGHWRCTSCKAGG